MLFTALPPAPPHPTTTMRGVKPLMCGCNVCGMEATLAAVGGSTAAGVGMVGVGSTSATAAAGSLALKSGNSGSAPVAAASGALGAAAVFVCADAFMASALLLKVFLAAPLAPSAAGLALPFTIFWNAPCTLLVPVDEARARQHEGRSAVEARASIFLNRSVAQGPQEECRVSITFSEPK